MAIATIFIFVVVVGFMFFFEIQDIIILGNKVEKALYAAGWTGFSKLDLKEMARRNLLTSIENRDEYLDKNQAKDIVEEYIKKNLKLDASMYPTIDSYITVKDQPVIVDEITVYNPNDLPAASSTGYSMTRTTIHIRVRIPIETRFTGFRYVEKSVHVDTNSFLTDEQI